MLPRCRCRARRPPPRRDRGRRLPADVRDGGALRGVRHPPARDRRVALRARRGGRAAPADPGRQRARSSRRRPASRPGRCRHHPRPGVERTRPLRRAASSWPRCSAAHGARRAARRRCAPARSPRRDRAARRHAAPPPTGCTPTSSRRATRASTSTRRCSTWTRASILTSAGTAAGIDLCLHLVRQDLGAEAANTVARRMVVPPHRDGGPGAVRADPGAARRRGRHPRARPDLDGRAPRRAAHRGRPRRPGAGEPADLRPALRRGDRHDADPVAAHPAGAAARALLETTDLPVERIAHECGFSTGAGLRAALPAGGRRLAGHLPAHVPRRSSPRRRPASPSRWQFRVANNDVPATGPIGGPVRRWS